MPQIWYLEVGNALIAGIIRKRMSEADAFEQLANLTELPIKSDGMTANLAWTEILTLARRHRLTTCDASYVEPALRLHLPLATRDTDIIAAAKKLDVEVLQF